MTDKSLLRRQSIQTRNGIIRRDSDFAMAAQNFMQSIAPQPGQSLALFWPKELEFDTRPLMEVLLNADFICGLPVVQRAEKFLRFAFYKAGDPLEKGEFGTAQPVMRQSSFWLDPDIIVVPLLAFDKAGHRLGYGGGHYDATLEHYRAMKSLVAVGYAYDEQEAIAPLPVEPHDQKLDWVITPTRAIRMEQ